MPQRLSANPLGGHDEPGAYAADGKRIVFSAKLEQEQIDRVRSLRSRRDSGEGGTALARLKAVAPPKART